jgi:hypothetical protein
MELWDPKVARVLVVIISGLPLGNPGTKYIWVLVPWPCIKYTIRGKVVAFPKLGHGESYESMVGRGSSMHQSALTMCRSL